MSIFIVILNIIKWIFFIVLLSSMSDINKAIEKEDKEKFNGAKDSFNGLFGATVLIYFVHYILKASINSNYFNQSIIVALFSSLFFIVLVIMYNDYVNKKFSNDYEKKHNKTKIAIAIISLLFVIFNGADIISKNNDSQIKQEKIAKKKADAKKKKQDEEKAKKESKKKRDEELDKKMDQEVKEARKKNDKKNLAEYKKALKSVPANSNNAITSAYIEKETSTTVAVLNDAALNYSSSELKNISHSAFNAMENIENKYLVRSNDSTDAPGNLEIRDSSGNVIAKRKLTGGFKYVGE